MCILRVKTFVKSIAITAATLLALSLSSCTFQPLYTSPDGTIGSNNIALNTLSVAEVDTREAQQVRNHLIFLLSGGVSPIQPTHEVRLRVSKTTRTLAGAIRTEDKLYRGKTAGSVVITATYDVYDLAKKATIATGRRTASAAFDKTDQSFANLRAERDATNRAAKEAAELIRLSISSDLTKS